MPSMPTEPRSSWAVRSGRREGASDRRPPRLHSSCRTDRRRSACSPRQRHDVCRPRLVRLVPGWGDTPGRPCAEAPQDPSGRSASTLSAGPPPRDVRADAWRSLRIRTGGCPLLTYGPSPLPRRVLRIVLRLGRVHLAELAHGDLQDTQWRGDCQAFVAHLSHGLGDGLFPAIEILSGCEDFPQWVEPECRRRPALLHGPQGRCRKTRELAEPFCDALFAGRRYERPSRPGPRLRRGCDFNISLSQLVRDRLEHRPDGCVTQPALGHSGSPVLRGTYLPGREGVRVQCTPQ